jgi:hypothetical protein
MLHSQSKSSLDPTFISVPVPLAMASVAWHHLRRTRSFVPIMTPTPLSAHRAQPRWMVVPARQFRGNENERPFFGKSIASSGDVADATARTNRRGRKSRKDAAPKDVDATPYADVAAAQLRRFLACVEPLRAMNAEFETEITSEEASVSLGREVGCVRLVLDQEREEIDFTGPISGTQSYRYDRSTCRWVGTRDGHDLEGLITRDLLRVSAGGIPLF